MLKNRLNRARLIVSSDLGRSGFWSLSKLQTAMQKFERLLHKLKKQQFLLSFDEKMEIKDNDGFMNVLINTLE